MYTSCPTTCIVVSHYVYTSCPTTCIRRVPLRVYVVWPLCVYFVYHYVYTSCTTTCIVVSHYVYSRVPLRVYVVSHYVYTSCPTTCIRRVTTMRLLRVPLRVYVVYHYVYTSCTTTCIVVSHYVYSRVPLRVYVVSHYVYTSCPTTCIRRVPLRVYVVWPLCVYFVYHYVYMSCTTMCIRGVPQYVGYHYMYMWQILSIQYLCFILFISNTPLKYIVEYRLKPNLGWDYEKEYSVGNSMCLRKSYHYQAKDTGCYGLKVLPTERSCLLSGTKRHLFTDNPSPPPIRPIPPRSPLAYPYPAGGCLPPPPPPHTHTQGPWDSGQMPDGQSIPDKVAMAIDDSAAILEWPSPQGQAGHNSRRRYRRAAVSTGGGMDGLVRAL